MRRPGDEGEPGGQEAPAGHQEWRDLGHAPADGEVGRSPDEVDGREGGNEGDARGMGHGTASSGES